MLKVVNPATEEIIAEIEEDTTESIAAKFAKASEAQKQWARSQVSVRLDAMRRFRALLVAQHDALAATLTREMGKPITQSKNELSGVLGRLDFFIQKTPPLLLEKVVLDDTTQGICEKIVQEPLGVIANISAWNYPYLVGTNVFAPALLTGNAVLYKPSEYAPLTGREIARLLHTSGIPEEVFIPIVGAGPIGAELLKLPLSGIFFTGSYATGRKILASLDGHPVKLQLEMGGKDPLYICEDVDIYAAAASSADGAFYNTGQSCCAVERIYVRQEIFEPFLSAFMKTVKGFTLGDPTDPTTDIGPVARREALTLLHQQVTDALQKGATLLSGGRRAPRSGFFFEPTVLTQVDHTMKVMRDESFGPIIGIQSVRSDEEAIQLMNDTEYGLTTGVYSNDWKRAEAILSRVNTGTAYWNCCDRVSPSLPWTGRGHSGIGVTLSEQGIQTFLQPRAWHLKQPAARPF